MYPAPMAKRPTLLGLTLTGGLLFGLLAWRHAVPASVWLDIMLLAAVGGLLLALRRYLQR